METLTKRPIRYTSGAELVVDTNSGTYATFTLSAEKANKNKDLIFYRFNFSEIPSGSIINDVILNIKSSTERHMRILLYAVRYYGLDGTWSGTDKVTPIAIIQQDNQSIQSQSFSGSNYIGTWTRDELAANEVCGIGIYLRIHRDGYLEDTYGNSTIEIPVSDRSCKIYDF